MTQGLADGVEKAAAPVAWSSLAFGRVISTSRKRREKWGLEKWVCGTQQVPGFAEALPAGTLAFDIGVEAEAFRGSKSFDGKDVPGVFGNDVGDKNVDLVGGVDDFALAVDGVDGLNVVAAGANDLGALGLDRSFPEWELAGLVGRDSRIGRRIWGW